jgi:hypothetical protein
MVGLPPMIAKFHWEELNFKASICCSKNLQVFPVPKFTDQLVVTCVWHTDLIGAIFRYFCIVSAYCPGLKEDIPNMLRKVIKHCANSNIEIICGIDSNPHSSCWGSRTDDRRGGIVKDLILEHNLHIINIGCRPTLVGVRGESIIDITLSFGNIQQFMSGWHVSQDYNGSDYRTIVFRLIY